MAAIFTRKGTDVRIDVQHRPEELDTELDRLYRRISSPADALHGISAIATTMPELVLRWREADGEYYVYVEDVARQCLAGYTVFNRLIEVGRRADRYLRAPHSKYAPAYQRRGIATALYEWALDAGLCLMSGARQSPGAHRLWHALSARHELAYVQVRDKAVRHVGPAVDPAVLNDLHTRMILLGRGWTIERLASAGVLTSVDSQVAAQ